METNDVFLGNNRPTPRSPQAIDNASTASSDFQSFLQLLTAQLRNQDPLSPLDSTQFVEQLASFSAVEQQIETNSHLEALSQNFATSGLENATQWVGQHVEAATNAASYKGEALDFVIPANDEADISEVVLFDSSGNAVYQQQISNERQAFSWDGALASGGKAEEGDYLIAVNRYVGEDITETVAPFAVSKVLEARLDNSSVKLLLSNGATIDPGEIVALRAADEEAGD